MVYGSIIKMLNDEMLKSFILYCQTVETMYQEWKNYWLTQLMKGDNEHGKETLAFIPHFDYKDYFKKID